jgi:hypothetical protein
MRDGRVIADSPQDGEWHDHGQARPAQVVIATSVPAPTSHDAHGGSPIAVATQLVPQANPNSQVTVAGEMAAPQEMLPLPTDSERGAT